MEIGVSTIEDARAQDGPHTGQGICLRKRSGAPYRRRHGCGLPSWRRPCGKALPAGLCQRRTPSSSPTRSTPGRPSRRRPQPLGSPWARVRGRPHTWSAVAAGRAQAGSRRPWRPGSRWPRRPSYRRLPPRSRGAASAGSPSAISRSWRGSAGRLSRTLSGRPRRSGSSRLRNGASRHGGARRTRCGSPHPSGARGSGCATGSGQGATIHAKPRDQATVVFRQEGVGSDPQPPYGLQILSLTEGSFRNLADRKSGRKRAGDGPTDQDGRSRCLRASPTPVSRVVIC